MNSELKIKQILLAIYLSLGCVVWFAGFSMGVVKAALLIAVLITNYRILFCKLPYWFFFLLFVLFFVVSSFFNGSFGDTLGTGGVLSNVWGFVDNYLFFVLGYQFAKKHLISKKMIFLTLVISAAYCFLTISNFLIHVPNWISPSVTEKADFLYQTSNYIMDKSPLYSTGFGLGRTGWGHSIALFLPLCLFCLNVKNKKFVIFSLLSISGSIMVSGSRGALLVLLVIVILYALSLKNKIVTGAVIGAMALFLLTVFLLIGDNTIMEFYRLDRDDVSTGRFEQLSYFVNMFSSMGFWGLGAGRTLSFLELVGIDYELHNTYLKFLIENGFLCFVFLMVVVVKALKVAFVCAKMPKTDVSPYLSLVVFSGLVSCLFEPSAVFGCRGWYVVWWFSFGTLCYSVGQKKRKAFFYAKLRNIINTKYKNEGVVRTKSIVAQ